MQAIRNWLSEASIRSKVRAGSFALIAILVAAGVFASLRVSAISLGGTMEKRIEQLDDLTSDVELPDENIVEPYRQTAMLLLEPETLQQRKGELAKLRKQYEDGRARWDRSDLDPELKTLLNKSHEPAARFWSDLDERFLPAAERGDFATAAAVFKMIENDYHEHRASIDKLVEVADADQVKVRDDAATMMRSATIILGIVALVVLALVTGAAFVLVTRVVGPLSQVSDATVDLAEGRAAAIPHLGRTDEIGRIAKAVEQFRVAAERRAEIEALQAREQQKVTSVLGDRLDALRDGDLTRFIDEEFPESFEVLRRNFNVAVGALREMVQRVSESAQDIDTGASEIATASEDLARRTERNAATLAATRGAIEEIDGRVRAGMENARQSVDRAGEANDAVLRGRGAADRAVASMDRVNASAQDIGSVIEGLDKIAFQTRVLSMNATVEAGRAGEAGRGFAVVADLVSALAQRAEGEAARVRELITLTQSEISGAVEHVRGTDEALSVISSRVDGVRGLLETMSTDNEAQAAAITQIARSAVDMDDATQRNAAMVEETSAAARNLSNEVAALAQRAAAFKFERRKRNIPVAVERRSGRRGTAADRGRGAPPAPPLAGQGWVPAGSA